jgi:uncharacterized membrane protein YvbJ
VKVCINCGMENEATATVCNSCGDDLPKELPPKKPFVLNGRFPKKLLIPIASIAVLLIAIGIYAGIASSNAKPLRVVELFEDAIVEGNVKQVMKLIEPGDPLLKIDETTAQQLITYYKENPSTFSDEMEQLKFDAEMWNDDISTATSLFAKSDQKPDEILSFIERKEVKGLFGKYGIEVKLFYFKVTTNQKGTVFRLNDKEILTAKVDYYDKVLGPFLPGTYKMKVDFNGEYVSLSAEKEVNLPEDHDKEIDLSLQALYIYPESNDPEAQLYVNGKDAGKTFKNMERFGPVASDGSMTVHAQRKTEWGMLYSDKVTITDGSMYPNLSLNGIYIYPKTNFPDAKLLINDKNTNVSIDVATNDGFGPLPYDTALTMQVEKIFPWGTYRSEKKPVKENATWDELNLMIDPLDDKIKGQLMGDVNTFLKTMIDAYNKEDISVLKNTTQSLKDKFEELIAGSNYTGDIVKTVYDLGTFSVYQKEKGQYTSTFTAAFTTNELRYGTVKEPYDYTWNFSAVYDEVNKKWIVSEYSGTYYFDGTNVKEFTF